MARWRRGSRCASIKSAALPHRRITTRRGIDFAYRATLLSRHHSPDGDRPLSAVVNQMRTPNDRYALEDDMVRARDGDFRPRQPTRGQTDRNEPTAALPNDVSRATLSQPIYGWNEHEGAIEE